MIPKEGDGVWVAEVEEGGGGGGRGGGASSLLAELSALFVLFLEQAGGACP